MKRRASRATIRVLLTAGLCLALTSVGAAANDFPTPPGNNWMLCNNAGVLNIEISGADHVATFSIIPWRVDVLPPSAVEGDWGNVSAYLGTGYSGQNGIMFPQNVLLRAKTDSSGCRPTEGGYAYFSKGVTSQTCFTKACRAGVWDWGIPNKGSNATVISAAAEHCGNPSDQCLGSQPEYIVDDYNTGRTQVAAALEKGITAGGWRFNAQVVTHVYPAGSIPQPDGSSAPYDGSVEKICIDNNRLDTQPNQVQCKTEPPS